MVKKGTWYLCYSIFWAESEQPVTEQLCANNEEEALKKAKNKWKNVKRNDKSASDPKIVYEKELK